jgi:hypothetical protein
MATWRELISAELENAGESWADVVWNTLTDEQLDAKFDNGYGGTEGEKFGMWTTNRVYFPLCYDGAEWVGSVPRNPQVDPLPHLGGG